MGDSITGLPFTRTISFASDPSNQPLNHLLPSRCLPRKLLAPPPPPKSRVRRRLPPPQHHASYKDMIKDAIINLKERNGSSRQAIKKYVKANNNVTITSETQFDSLFNKALKSGVEKGDFQQPKGPSGPVKLAKKEA